MACHMACHMVIVEAKRRGCFPDQGQIRSKIAEDQGGRQIGRFGGFNRRLRFSVLPAKYGGGVVSPVITG